MNIGAAYSVVLLGMKLGAFTLNLYLLSLFTVLGMNSYTSYSVVVLGMKLGACTLNFETLSLFTVLGMKLGAFMLNTIVSHSVVLWSSKDGP